MAAKTQFTGTRAQVLPAPSDAFSATGAVKSSASQVQFGGFWGSLKDGISKRAKVKGAQFDEGASKVMERNLPAVLKADLKDKMASLKQAREAAAKPAGQYKLATDAVTALQLEVQEQEAKALRYAEAWDSSGRTKFADAATEESNKLKALETRLEAANAHLKRTEVLHSEAANRINQLEDGLKTLRGQYEEAILAHEANKDKENLAEAMMAIQEINGELTATSQITELIRKTKEKGATLDALIDGTYKSSDIEARARAAEERKELEALESENSLSALLAKKAAQKQREQEAAATKTGEKTMTVGGGTQADPSDDSVDPLDQLSNRLKK